MNREDPLSRELTLYEASKRDWLSLHANQFVVISRDEVQGFYPDYETAFRAGIQAFGIQRPFLVKEISATEPVYVVY
jgi:hypothetical protein